MNQDQRRIKYSIILFFIFFITSVYSQNKYPIILVHGFMGWGREEMGSYRYWGGKYDIEKELRDNGYEVFTANIGPLSSNWDRAIELFYQIKGGQVDYGKGHSQSFGIIQKPKGKTFKGFYPKWNKNNPVHLIGHSLGGQTIRMLDYLLKTSIQDSSNIKEKSDFLGNINNGWIKSITSISTPHNGTTLSDIVTTGIPIIQDINALGGVMGNS